MILGTYDFVLIIGLLVCLFLLSAGVRALLKPRIVGASLTSVKFLAIFGILFFVTALVGGSALTGYMAKEIIGDKINIASNKLQDNNLDSTNLKTTIYEIKNNLNAAPASAERDQLLAQIDYLEKKIKRQQDVNHDLEDDLDDIKDELKDLYALLPGGHY